MCDLAAVPCPLSLHVSRQYTLQPVTMPPLPSAQVSDALRKAWRSAASEFNAPDHPVQEAAA